MKRALLILGLLGILVTPVFGQGVKAKIPFQFVVSTTTLPAGDYEFKADVTTNHMTVRNEQTGKAVTVNFITRLAADRTTPAGSNVTFDVVGDRRYLETVWPGMEDGYLIKVTKEVHTHEVVRGG